MTDIPGDIVGWLVADPATRKHATIDTQAILSRRTAEQTFADCRGKVGHSLELLAVCRLQPAPAVPNPITSLAAAISAMERSANPAIAGHVEDLVAVLGRIRATLAKDIRIGKHLLERIRDIEVDGACISTAIVDPLVDIPPVALGYAARAAIADEHRGGEEPPF